jgi:chromate transporter
MRGRSMLAIAILAFIGIFLFSIPFPLIIAAAALIGVFSRALGFKDFELSAHPSKSGKAADPPASIDAAFDKEIPGHIRPSLPRLIRIAVIGASIWLAPLVTLLATLGPTNVFTAIAAFNSRMAVVTFGGAYAVLAYMAQQAVEYYHWLKPQEMLVGLGFAETTPGPLISVVQFVGFMAAFRQPGSLSPALAGTLGGLMAQWSTFVPSFLWIFMGAPYIESLRNNKVLSAALAAITAAVVGVIANLAIWFALHTLFGEVQVRHVLGMSLQIPVLKTIIFPALAVSIAAVIALFRFKVGMIATLLGSSVAGILMHFAGWLG